MKKKTTTPPPNAPANALPPPGTRPPDHPLAAIFPMMEAGPTAELAQDIKTNGLREKIVILNGQILDGRNRFAACEIAKVEPQWEFHDERRHGDPLAYVLSKNLKRRHLTQSQRAVIAAEALPLFEEQARLKQAAAGKGHAANLKHTTPAAALAAAPAPKTPPKKAGMKVEPITPTAAGKIPGTSVSSFSSKPPGTLAPATKPATGSATAHADTDGTPPKVPAPKPAPKPAAAPLKPDEVKSLAKAVKHDDHPGSPSEGQVDMIKKQGITTLVMQAHGSLPVFRECLEKGKHSNGKKLTAADRTDLEKRVAAAQAVLDEYPTEHAELLARLKEIDGEKNGPKSRDVAGAALGVSGRMVQDAKSLLEQAPEQAAEVKAGHKSLAAAKAEAALDSAEVADALGRIQEVCGKSLADAAREQTRLKGAKEILAYAALDNDTMLKTRGLINQGWSVKDATAYKLKTLARTHRIADLLDRAAASDGMFTLDIEGWVISVTKKGA